MSDTPKSAAPSSGLSLFGSNASGGNATASPTTNLFGQNASANTGASTTSNSLFGGGQKPLFGGATTSGGFSAAPSPSLSGGGFGAASGSAGFGFGKKPDDNKPASPSLFSAFATPSKTTPVEGSAPANPFGNKGGAPATTSQAPSGSATPTAAQPKFSFGNVSTTPAGPPPSQGGSVFNLGQVSKSGNSLFGAPSSSQTNPPQSPALFGGQQPASATSQTSTSSLFGNAASTAPAKTGSSLFGGASSAAPTSNLFGKPSIENKPAEGSSTPSAAPKANFFGSPGPNTAGNTTSDASKPEQSAAKRPALSFGPTTTADKPASGQSTPNLAAPSLFGNAPATSTTSATGLFGNVNANKEAPAASAPQTPSFFSGIGEKKDGAAASTSGLSMFSGIGQKKDTPATSAAPSPGLFGNALNAKKDATDASAKPQDAAATAPAPTTAASGAGLFGSLNKPAESSTTSNQTTGGTPANAAASLGASTAGPAPSNQSRLKNKSMDEIVTRWASDLSKYQKEFQAQAEKVASWDRLLLENGNAISKLYSKTFQAERDTAEVQKQLSAVEGHQDELEQWLDRYEREVDEMMARQIGQGEGLQGPDQERERTYKTAERVSERLNDMGKELTSMIEEINEASAAISKTSKADDPLSQIVRVLNGHLSQLQLIDQGTAALQAKVTAAQKESQKLGSRGHGHSLGFDRAADDFYKSYMGRG